MSTCAICLDTLKSPTAYPCGHVFCYQCIAQTVQRLSPMSTTSCPTCRASFPLVAINPALVPPHLRPFFLAPFRRLYLDEQAPSTPSSPEASSSKQTAELASLKSENATLRQSSAAWRHRAETHAATALGLAAVMRMARAQIRAEREALRKHGEDLKRREAELDRLNSKNAVPEFTHCDDGELETSTSTLASSHHHRSSPPSSRESTPSPKRGRAELDETEARPASKKKKLWVDDDAEHSGMFVSRATDISTAVALLSHRVDPNLASFPSTLPAATSPFAAM